MRTVSALFSNRLQAKLTVAALVASGIRSEEISIISSGTEGELTENATGVAAGTGAILGGAAGLLTGLGLMAIPGLGPIVAAGWLASTLTGAASGAAIGGIAGNVYRLLIEAGVSETDANIYSAGIEQGGTFLAVRVSDEQYETAERILEKARRFTVMEVNKPPAPC
ncbi:hypothetical protein [Brucella intermedia]|uniref:hypothetical protein n=1 Tax=Brucella intermedia TaxID=94625 RepID=UPI00236253C1|nr:hypothetical protein [Brucella intermedia]